MTRKLHTFIDCPVAFGLIIMPFLLNLGTSHPLAFTLSVLTGIAALVLMILTNQ